MRLFLCCFQFQQIFFFCSGLHGSVLKRRFVCGLFNEITKLLLCFKYLLLWKVQHLGTSKDSAHFAHTDSLPLTLKSEMSASSV